MDYYELIETLTELVTNDKILKDGLIIFYELEEENHRLMDEHLFYKVNEKDIKFEHRDIIEVEVEGITIQIIKKGGKLVYEDLELSE